MIWGDYISDIENIVDTYNPDIVIIEAAERVDRTAPIIEAAENIKKRE